MNSVWAGLIAGWLYFQTMERSIPFDVNCSYYATPTTDWLALLASAWLINDAQRNDSPGEGFIGASILSIHVGQLMAKRA